MKFLSTMEAKPSEVGLKTPSAGVLVPARLVEAVLILLHPTAAVQPLEVARVILLMVVPKPLRVDPRTSLPSTPLVDLPLVAELETEFKTVRIRRLLAVISTRFSEVLTVGPALVVAHTMKLELGIIFP